MFEHRYLKIQLNDGTYFWCLYRVVKRDINSTSYRSMNWIPFSLSFKVSHDTNACYDGEGIVGHVVRDIDSGIVPLFKSFEAVVEWLERKK